MGRLTDLALVPLSILLPSNDDVKGSPAQLTSQNSRLDGPILMTLA